MKDKIKLNFSKGVKNYDKYAVVQKELAIDLVDFLDKEEFFNILEIGCGTGFLTKLLRKKYPMAKITTMDISESMVNKTKEHFYGDKNISFIVEDIEKFELKETYDLIISSATFQWIEDFELLMTKLYEGLKFGGSISFTTFVEGTFKELDFSINEGFNINGIRKQWKRSYLTFEELEHIVIKVTECKIRAKHKTYEEWFENSLEFLKSVKAIGANSSEISKYITNKIMRDIVKIYNENYEYNSKVKVTYESALFKVKKI